MEMRTGAIIAAAVLADMAPREQKRYVSVPKEFTNVRPGDVVDEPTRQAILDAAEKRTLRQLKRIENAKRGGFR